MFISLPVMPFSLAMEAETISPEQLITFAIVFSIAMILAFLLTVFVEGALLVGVKRFLLDTALENKADISNIFYGFKNGYKSIATTALMKNLIILGYGIIPIIIAYLLTFILAFSFGDTVWFTPVMLIIIYASFIPLAMKTYDFYLTDYILAENPDMYWRDVLKRSKTMMRGNRRSAFVMHLSFIGWILLGFFACFVGVMFVDPYIQATDAQLYMELSGKNEPEVTEDTIEL